MTRDQCSPQLTWNYNSTGTGVESVTLTTAQSNRCSAEIPVTVPNGVRSAPSSSRAEKIGSDPLTLWVKMNGSSVTIQLDQSIPL
jgi:S1-C subfamily serine protease